MAAPGSDLARAALAALLAVTLAAVLLPLSVGASELTEEEELASEHEGVQLADDRLVGPADASWHGFWVWPESRRGYFLKVDPAVAAAGGTRGAFDELIAIDLDSGQELGRGPLSPPAWITRGGESGSWASGQDHTIAVDRAGGRLFVPYGINWRQPQSTSSASGPQAQSEPVLSSGRLCASQAAAPADSRCVGGVHVVDAVTLETMATIPLSAPLVLDAPGSGGFMPMLRAVRYTPPREGEPEGGKVHLVVEDYQYHLFEFFTQYSTRLSTQQMSVHWAIQLDIASGDQDWAVRLEACRGTRDAGNYPRLAGWQPFPATVFKGPNTGDLYVGCSAGSARQAVVVRVPLDADGRPEAPVAAGDPASGIGRLLESGPGTAGPDDVAQRGARQRNWVGPDGGIEFHADPASGRMVIRANPGLGEMWWVFDEAEQAFIGAVGIGDDYHLVDVVGGLDEATGRLYVLAGKVSGHTHYTRGRQAPGGLFVADIRHTPLPQAVHYPQFAPPERGGFDGMSLVVDSAGPDRPRRIFHRRTGSSVRPVFEIIADVEEVPAAPEPPSFDGLTLDLDEVEGVTSRSFDGAARGYGARVIMLGGLGGVPRAGPVDASTAVSHWDDPNAESGGLGAFGEWGGDGLADPCLYANRELVLAFSGPDGPAVVDGTGSRGGVQPVLADARTADDAAAPVSRCSPQDWQGLWSAGLLSRPPADEPGAWPFDRDSRSECVSGTDEETAERWSDPYLGRFHGEVRCEEDQAGGRTGAGGLRLDDPGMPEFDAVSVTEAVSNFRVYLDPDRGLVARVESVARGVRIGDVVSIDTVRGTAESWANGRANRAGAHDPGLERDLGLAGPHESPDEDADSQAGDEAAEDPGGASFNPFNCDTTRTAGTCFSRHFFGVSVGDGRGGAAYQCGPCGDEQALVDALDAALGTNGAARLRNPDPGYARGADNGYLAGIVKPDSERFADMILNTDNLQTVVPSLEIIRYAPANSFYRDVGNVTDEEYLAPQARQIVQLAGIEVSSTYSIQCLLEYDPVTNVCAESLPDPASLNVELIDLDGAALAGGAFELRHDTDGDGVLGLIDELVEGGACATGPEGVCSFDGLEPGSYLVSQTSAPEGYAPVDEPLAVNLFPGDDLTVTFTNVPNVSTIALTVTDLDGTPVEGAVFGVFPDADYVAASASPGGVEPVATCTTDADGVCSMTVPPGAYVLRQLSAPDGLLPIDDIAFVISQAGQTADVALTLGAAGADPVPVTEPAAGPVDDFAPPPAPSPLAQPAVSIAPAPPRSAPSVTATSPAMSAPPPAIAEQVGGTIVRVIRSPANALRLAARSPIEAASLVMVLLLVGLAVMAVIRRQQLATLLASPGHGGPTSGPGTAPPSGRGGGGPGSGPPGREPSTHAGPSGGSDGPEAGPSAATSTATRQPETREAQGPGVHAATAVLERPAAKPATAPPVVAGAAPSPTEGRTVTVVVATAYPALAALASQRLAAADRCELLATVDSAEALMAAIDEHAPGVVVVDLSLAVEGSDDVCDLLADAHPPEHTVGLIPPNRDTAAFVTRGHRMGLGGLLVADDDLGNGNLAYAVRQVGAGKPCHGPTVQAVLLEQWGEHGKDRKAQGLTRRELEIARLAAEGLSRTEIAERLFVSPWTVKLHLKAARAKLGVTNPWDAEQLRRRLDDHGLLDPDPDVGP